MKREKEQQKKPTEFWRMYVCDCGGALLVQCTYIWHKFMSIALFGSNE